jgi:hypothetical protein
MSHLLLMRRQGAVEAGERRGMTTTSGPASTHPRAAHAAPPPPPSRGRRCLAPAVAALPEWFAKIVDFESWAPRSSRMWRLDQYSYERSTSSSDEEVEREVALQGLQARVDALRRAERPAARDAADEEPSTSPSIDPDAPLTAAAIARAASEGSVEDQAAEVEEEDVPPLTADEVRLLLLKKWGKQYDMAFVRRDLPGMRPFCALCFFPNSLEQRSFILTEAQYVEKLEGVCARLHVLGRTRLVRSFLEAPAKSQKGLPRRPTMGTAVSIQLDLSPAQIEAYFTGPI